jgi:hypothetical protein
LIVIGFEREKKARDIRLGEGKNMKIGNLVATSPHLLPTASLNEVPKKVEWQEAESPNQSWKCQPTKNGPARSIVVLYQLIPG